MAMKGNKLLGSKGVTVWDMSKIAMTLVFIGVTLAVGVWVNLTRNVSWNATNNTYETLAYRGVVSNVGNATGGNWPTKTGLGSAYWESRDYGYRTQVILYTNATADYDNPTVMTLNITYAAYNSTEVPIVMNATEGIYTLAKWLPVIMVVFAAAIIIAALMMWFGRR